MSKKQREKVEDEVRFHRAQLVRPHQHQQQLQQQQPPLQTPQATETSPDSSVFDQQQPSSSNQHIPYLSNGYGYSNDLNAYTPNGYSYNNQTMSFDLSSTDFVDSTTFDPRQLLEPIPDTSSLLSTSISSGTITPTPSTSHIDLLARTVSEAYARTCLFTTEQIHEMMRRPQDVTRILYYKNLAHEHLWLDCAQRLTNIIQQIIEFAKMVPGFMKLSQDDQIVLLKSGGFELSIIRMSRYYDLNTRTVLYGESLLPAEAFITSETTEMKLVNNAFDFARSIAEVKMNDTELALYSAYVLLSPDRPGLKGLADIQRLNQATLKALRQELDRTHKLPFKGDITICDALLARIPALRELSILHMEALAKLRRTAPQLEFPALHKELFSGEV